MDIDEFIARLHLLTWHKFVHQQGTADFWDRHPAIQDGDIVIGIRTGKDVRVSLLGDAGDEYEEHDFKIDDDLTFAWALIVQHLEDWPDGH